MSARLDLRMTTSLLVGAACALTIAAAAPTLRYGLAEARMTDVDAEALLAGFADDRLVGHLARRRLLALGSSSDARSRVAEAETLLAHAPATSDVWLELARARFAEGAGPEKVISALAMSRLVGPNEAVVMAGRASFALPLWAMLTQAMRETAVRDLLGGWSTINEARRTILAAVLTQARTQTRADLRAALFAEQEPGQAVARRLGLSAAD